ncbi:MAG TPA: ABC transporter permease [Capsulimonadaceae bacterium]|jgi:putative ABC transport system permease protein
MSAVPVDNTTASTQAADDAASASIGWGQAIAVNFTMALRGVGANKLRAFLTVLGVVIGVAAVIVAVAIGQGSRAAVAESLKRLGTNTLTVLSGQMRSGGIGLGAASMVSLKLADADMLLKQCPSLLSASPQVSGSAQIKYKDANTNTTVSGTGLDYPSIANHNIASGRFYTAKELKSYARVVVLGSTAATNIFGQQTPVGKHIRVAGQSFLVIGLLKTKGGMGFRNPDDGVYVPVTTAMRRLFGVQNIREINCQARSESEMKSAQDEIRTALRKAHRLSDTQDDDFTIMNQADLQEAQNQQQDTFASLITYLAVVSLLVGGIGIMNIMLVSVTERTREIGVRKAIGAKRRDILLQFLIEALLLSLVGGLLGVAFGVIGAKLVALKNGWNIVLAPETLLLSFSFSAFVGIFFGFYPALKASKLHPIDALRYE